MLAPCYPRDRRSFASSARSGSDPKTARLVPLPTASVPRSRWPSPPAVAPGALVGSSSGLRITRASLRSLEALMRMLFWAEL